MRIRLIAVGGRMPAWVDIAYGEYSARLPRGLSLELVELPLAARGRNADLARVREAEGQKILKAVPRDGRLVALDGRGEPWTSRELAEALRRWQLDGRDIALAVGGPDGHAPEVIAAAAQRWSLSPLTLPHALVRVLVAEQLYRAASLLAGHPYHRERGRASSIKVNN